MNRSTGDHPGDVRAYSLDALEEGVLVPKMMSFIEDESIPLKCVERSEEFDLLRGWSIVFASGAFCFEGSGEHVVGGDDDGSLRDRF